MQRARSNVTMTVSVALLGATALFSGCLRSSSNCQDDGVDCPATGGSGGTGANSAGTAGKGGGGTGGSSGNAQGGSTSGDAGQPSGGSDVAGGGTTGGEGGTGGMVSLPCDGACAAPKPICDELNDTCVQCLKEQDCTTAAKKKCDATTKACVECLAPADCPNATAAKCDAGTCAKCTSNDDCAHIAGKTTCDTGVGECVQCTGKDYAACGESMGTPLICDTVTRTCTTTKEHSAGLCSVCVSDAHCQTGQLCVKEQYGSPTKQDVGYFCFSRQAAVPGADCTLLDNQPYVATLKKQTTIDGDTADICGLAVSTCIARKQFRSKDCKTSSAADDQKCGFAPGKDSKCSPFGASQFLCTMTCLSDFDCPTGAPCDTDASPAVCKLELL